MQVDKAHSCSAAKVPVGEKESHYILVIKRMGGGGESRQDKDFKGGGWSECQWGRDRDIRTQPLYKG